jgi:predicted MFS family arabinose efflux permease
MWMGACTSSIGTWMQKLAQSWLVLQISGSPFWLGVDAFLGEIPIVMLSLVGGVMADRIERRKLLIMSQVIQLTCAFVLSARFAFGHVHVWEILTLSFVVGCAQAFGGPAYQALIPTLVDSEDLPNAIALNSIQFNLARVIGPVLGGLALTKLGASWCFALNGLSFLAVIASLMLLRRRYIPPPASGSMAKQLVDGLKFIRRQGDMEMLIVLAFAMTLLGFPMLNFLPVMVKEVFHGGPEVFTLFLSVSGAGSVVGALIVAAIGNVRRKGLVALATLAILGASMTGFSASHWLPLSCLMLFVGGAALLATFAMISSLVQLITTNEMRGRVMSVYNVAFRGGGPVGNLLAGTLIPQFTAPWVLGANGVLLAVLAGYFLFVQRRVAAL